MLFLTVLLPDNEAQSLKGHYFCCIQIHFVFEQSMFFTFVAPGAGGSIGKNVGSLLTQFHNGQKSKGRNEKENWL